MDAQASEGETMLTVTLNSAPRFIVEAYDANNVMLGEITIPYAQLADAT